MIPILQIKKQKKKHKHKAIYSIYRGEGAVA